jgi:hypothetical protein
MANGPLLSFPHRHNRDGSWDSICPNCHLTIAKSETESDLHAFEQRHDCVEYARERERSMHFAFKVTPPGLDQSG